MMDNKIIIVTGPTASGKTDLAIKIALQDNFEIINADAMQVYLEIPVITAQPNLIERQGVPHWLLGDRLGGEICSVASWLNAAKDRIKDIHQRNKRVILIGGSGMYIKALVDGINDIPAISGEVREKSRKLYDSLGKEKFYNFLVSMDHLVENKIRPSDMQRMIRAFEVFEQTGESIFKWQEKAPRRDFESSRYIMVQTDLPRAILHQRINDRFHSMVRNGAIDEAEYVMKKYSDQELPINKAHGLPELKKYLQGQYKLEQAIERGQIITRQYAKRQLTWLRHQMPDIKRVIYRDTEDMSKICDSLLKTDF
jgi:tRNA dimethylallyltransferase